MVKQVFNRSEQIKEVNVSTRYQPGISGNPAGRPKDAVSTLLKLKDRQAIADKLYEMALAGDMKAIDMFLDRTEGKVDSNLKLTGDIPVSIVFKREPEALPEAPRDTESTPINGSGTILLEEGDI